VSTVYLLSLLLLNLSFNAFVYCGIVLPLMCCFIRAVLHPVWSAASDPGLELYKINFKFQSKTVFKRISYAYRSALDNSDPSGLYNLIRF